MSGRISNKLKDNEKTEYNDGKRKSPQSFFQEIYHEKSFKNSVTQKVNGREVLSRQGKTLGRAQDERGQKIPRILQKLLLSYRVNKSDKVFLRDEEEQKAPSYFEECMKPFENQTELKSDMNFFFRNFHK